MEPAIISQLFYLEKYQYLSWFKKYPAAYMLMSLVLILLLEVFPVVAQTNITRPVNIDASRYPTLQAAFDAVSDSGGVVNIPPGNYELTEPLILTRKDTHIKGAGTATHLININQTGEPALIVRPNNIPDKSTYIWRIQLSDFRISGNIKSGDGLLLEKVDELYISGLSVDHNGRHGINMIDCVENPRINHCNITYNRAGAGINLLRSHDVIVSANQFEENQDALRFIDGFNLTMTGNNIDDHLRHGIVVENAYGSVISGNMIEECNGTAIILQAPASPANRHCYGITICSNVIAHNFGGGVELTGAWGCSVSANTFTLDHKYSIFVGPGSGRITITGNNFGNSHGKLVPQKPDNPQTWDICTGITLQGTSDISISGNSFCGLSNEAVKGDAACKRILVSTNVISEVNMSLKVTKPSVDLGGAKGCMVENNIISEDVKVKQNPLK